MRNKQLQGIVVRDPFRMGELGVTTIVDHLQGRSVDKRVDTGATMVAPENMDTPEAQRLLHPRSSNIWAARDFCLEEMG